MLRLIYISEGLRYFRICLKRKLFGPKQYTGSAEQICRQIIDDCWNGKYFMNSAGHYSSFWARDFAFSVDALLKLGYNDKVLKTLDYALSIYKKKGHITSTVYPNGIAANFPDFYSPDSVALIFYSLKQAKAKRLVSKYRSFLNQEIKYFYNTVLDEKTGLVKRNTNFSGARDYALRDSSCYDNCMLALMAKTIKELNLDNPFKEYDFKKIIKEKFWSGDHFIDNLTDIDIVTGDANTIPFWTGLFTDKGMMKKTFALLQKQGFDNPLPLKYQARGKKRMIFIEVFVKNWEYDCVWSQFGFLYLQLLKKLNKDRAKTLINKYRQQLEKYRTGYELFNTEGKPYKSLFYMADEAMLWYANFLTL